MNSFTFNPSKKNLKKIICDLRNKTDEVEYENVMYLSFIQSIDEKYPESNLSTTSTCSDVAKTLEPDLKMLIAHSELKKCRRFIESFEENARKEESRYKVVSEQLNDQLSDVSKMKTRFKRFCRQYLQTSGRRHISSEQFLKYYKTSLRKRETFCDELRLRSETLKHNLRNLRQILQLRTETSEMYSSAAYNELQIKNDHLVQVLSGIRSKANNLKLKDVGVKEILNKMQSRLQEIVDQLERFQKESEKRKRIFDSLVRRQDEVIKNLQEEYLNNHILVTEGGPSDRYRVMETIQLKASEKKNNKKGQRRFGKLELPKLVLRQKKRTSRHPVPSVRIKSIRTPAVKSGNVQLPPIYNV
ncbi:unnamed protein product [Calicophoron daubneyi]|uniref:Uncharacterized protein n=1 Tax=Calicophoron daubneyi TaxID=300641 RepID=A0AAV2TA95_CALDB